MRELDQIVQSRNRVQKAAHEARLIPAALQTAELVNVVGALGGGKKWKPVTPRQYYEAWTGSKSGPAMTAKSLREIEHQIESSIKAREIKVQARRATREQSPAETQSEVQPNGTH